jgi:hypothetical protein
MENCRKSVLFLVLSVFFIAVSVSARAETVEEKKAAANYDETLPGSEKVQAEESASERQVYSEAQSAPAAMPEDNSAAMPSDNPAPMIEDLPAVMPGENPAMIAEESPAKTPENSPAPSNPSAKLIPLPAVPATAPTPSSEAVQPSSAMPVNVSQNLPETQVYAPSNASGIVEVSGYKYPVFLFIPKDYKTDRTYAMIMIAPAESAKAEQQIEYLSGLAQRKSIFILAPYVLWPKAGDTPYTLDEWLLTVKRDVMERFPISKKRVYLVGKDLGGHYAAYMAIKYPKEFAAAALLGEAWDGPFSQLIQPRTDAADQVPFYVALKADGDARSRNQAWLDQLQRKGYPIHLVDYKTDEERDNLEFKKTVFDWMEATGQSWEVSASQAPKTWKGKFKKGVKDFFAV